jgi:peptidoglycan hydrolase CwlO-like protein
MVRKQQLTEQRKKLPPQVGQLWNLTPESLAENERLDKEIKEAEAKLKEIREKLSHLTFEK